jgi:hypothetical protein
VQVNGGAIGPSATSLTIIGTLAGRTLTKKKWTNRESTSFYSGETLTASATQKCKQKKK